MVEMNIEQNKSLKELNTFGIDAYADFFIPVTNTEELRTVVDSTLFKCNKRLIIGGGSNILFTGDFPGLVISVEIPGLNIVAETNDYAIIEAGAGVIWHDLVKYALSKNLYGFENLAMIPGKVGAAPVQNIGAYGAEQKEFFLSLTGIDTKTGESIEMDVFDCKFGYRQSIFKHEMRNQVIVTSVRYMLSKHFTPNLYYHELAYTLEKSGHTSPTANDVFEAVCSLRTKKLPDTADLGNVGSFFKNPIVEKLKYNIIKTAYQDAPSYPATNGNVKLSAGWLIEKCGFLGKRIGDAGVFDKHALIIVNHGGASGKDIHHLALDIIAAVAEKFKVEIEPEVIIV